MSMTPEEIDKIYIQEHGMTKGAFSVGLQGSLMHRNSVEEWAEGDPVKVWLEGKDVGEKSVELFKETLKDAKTVVWNGPMGVFEMPNFAKGTLALGEFLATLSDATTIVGGGDSVAAAKQLGIADKLSHVSTGGGSSLEYLEGKTLPAIAVLSEK